VHTTLPQTLTTSIRRSLTYPLHRNLTLSTLIQKDVTILLRLGRRAILKTLLAIRGILRRHETAYVYDRLFLEDYCLWVQSGCLESVVREVGREVGRVRVGRGEVGFGLVELEARALELAGEEGEEEGEEEEKEEVEE
ncbi:hypothetical protein HDU67_005438, partial [Dinochytrium kinnereticum]